jgi:hypothetical protein
VTRKIVCISFVYENISTGHHESLSPYILLIMLIHQELTNLISDKYKLMPAFLPFHVCKLKMKATFVSVVALIVQLSSSENEIIQKFIRTSNTSVSIIFIDHFNKSINFEQDNVPTVILSFNFTTFNNCHSYANADFYEGVPSTSGYLLTILIGMEHHDFIIFTSSQQIETILRCIVHPMSRFLVIVSNASSQSHLTQTHITRMLNNTWTHNGAFKVFIMMSTNVFTFDPFHRNNDGSYGKLNSFVKTFESGSGSVSARQLNGYPLRIELFKATYTNFSGNVAKSVDDFTGPDANVARIVRHHLNATSLSFFYFL